MGTGNIVVVMDEAFVFIGIGNTQQSKWGKEKRLIQH